MVVNNGTEQALSGARNRWKVKAKKSLKQFKISEPDVVLQACGPIWIPNKLKVW